MLEAWFFIAAALLIVSGGTKLYNPVPTRGALKAAGLPAGAWTAPALGVGEIAAGAAGLVLGGLAAGAVALVYAGFAGFVVYALVRKLPISSCGCFGKTDTPPTVGHLTFNLMSATLATAVAVGGSAPIDVLAGQPLGGVPYLVFTAIGVAVVYLLLTELPALSQAREGR